MLESRLTLWCHFEPFHIEGFGVRHNLKRKREANHLRAARATMLITMWNHGAMTTQALQKIAKSVHKDMATMREWNYAKMVSGGTLVTSEMDHFEDLEVLSKIGASGDEVSNCLRDLGRHLAQVINHQGVAAYATKPLGTTCLCVALCKLGTHHANSRFVSHP